MTKSQRIFVLFSVPFAALLVWLVYGSTVVSHAAEAEAPAAADNPAKAKLEQAAQAVADAAKESVNATTNDQEAVRRAQLSFEILRGIGELGSFDTNPQADKLMEDLRAGGRPSVVEAIVQLQFTSKLRMWTQMNDTERAAALDTFVAEVKKSGLTLGYAELLMRLANMWGDRDQTKMIAKAIADVLPTVKDTDDPKMKLITRTLEGIGRRLDLLGKPIELEGKLLDGSEFDWSSYKGKVVLVDFSASWCGPCRNEAPNVLKNYRAYHDKGFEVVTVSLDVDPKAAEKCIKETGCDFPTLFSDDPNAKGWEHPMATKYGVTAIPRVVLVGQDGNVVSTSARGPMLGELLNKLLGPPAESAETGDEEKSSSTKQPTGGRYSGAIGVAPAGGVPLPART